MIGSSQMNKEAMGVIKFIFGVFGGLLLLALVLAFRTVAEFISLVASNLGVRSSFVLIGYIIVAAILLYIGFGDS